MKKRNKEKVKSGKGKTVKKVILIAFLAAVVFFVTGIVYFEIEPQNTNINYDAADSQKQIDKTIRFNSDGKLKILHIADTHLNYDKHFDYIETAEDNGDRYSKRLAFELAVKGSVQEGFLKLYQSVVELFTGRQVTYPD